MQDPNNSHTRKRWYQRAIEATTLWKALSKPIDFPIKNISSPWKANISKTTQLNDQTTTTPPSSKKLRKCSSTKSSTTMASPFSHVYCLCASISSSYTDIFQTNVVVPRRSCTYGRSRSLSSSSRGEKDMASRVNARASVEGRRMFRGKSLRDDVLMRRFVVEEESMKMMMRVRRRNEMEVIRRRSGMRKNKIGPSPLSRMVLAN